LFSFLFYLFNLITSTITTEIVESAETTSQTQVNDESYGAEEEEEYNELDMTGRIIADNYRILSKLGAGSFGQVYLCEHIHTHKQWAMKIELHNPNNKPILSSEVDDFASFFFCFS
jgi:serine/threonine protein kinase